MLLLIGTVLSEEELLTRKEDAEKILIPGTKNAVHVYSNVLKTKKVEALVKLHGSQDIIFDEYEEQEKRTNTKHLKTRLPGKLTFYSLNETTVTGVQPIESLHDLMPSTVAVPREKVLEEEMA